MSIYEKLRLVQSELKAPKNQYNSFGKYKYRSCEDILEAVKPLLKEHGLTLIITDEVVPVDVHEEDAAEMTKSDRRIYIKSTAVLFDDEGSVQTEAFAREAFTKRGMDSSQVTGTASSYARKYALNGLFLIDDSKDDDTREPTDAKPSQNNHKTSTDDGHRQKLLARVRQLISEAGSFGLPGDLAEMYVSAHFGKMKVDDLDADQLTQLGKHLRQTIDDKKEIENGK